MSVALAANLYGNAALYYDPNGTMGAASPTGPRLVHWMAGGLLSLVTVNGSNLGATRMNTYAKFSSVARFVPGTFQHACLLRTGPMQHLVPMNLIYPT